MKQHSSRNKSTCAAWERNTTVPDGLDAILLQKASLVPCVPIALIPIVQHSFAQICNKYIDMHKNLFIPLWKHSDCDNRPRMLECL